MSAETLVLIVIAGVFLYLLGSAWRILLAGLGMLVVIALFLKYMYPWVSHAIRAHL
jgi:uncharacterized membrane protein YccC